MPKNDTSLTPWVGRLRTLHDIQKELTRVYKAMRRGEIPTQDGTRLSYTLQVLAKIIEGGDLEQRVAHLEKHAQVHASVPTPDPASALHGAGWYNGGYHAPDAEKN
jgi:hypothetical protein